MCSGLAVSCRAPSDWQFLTRTQAKGRRTRVAQWYVYWEALDNRKGGGCCWNVTTIDEKHGRELPNLDTHARSHTHTHTYTQPRTHPHNLISIPITPRRRKNLQQCTGQDGITVFYKLISTWKIHSYTYMREIFFIGTAKAIKCVYLYDNKNNDKK